MQVPLAVALVLGAMLVFGSSDPIAIAQSERANRGSYLTVTARSGEGDATVLWLLDTRAEELAVAGWSQRSKGLETWGTRSLQQDLAYARRQR